MKPFSLNQVKTFEPAPGYLGKLVHTDQMTVAHWDIAADHALPEHSHPQEQVVNMMSGEFELVIAGEPHRLVAGDVVIIPGNVPHRGVAITDCKIIDVWTPARDDYRVAAEQA